MRILRGVIVFALVNLGAFCSLAKGQNQAEPQLPPRVFSHPDRIRYDSQCFTIEGKDTFIFSGAFHYFRCPKELWNDRFDKIRAAGFNAVETYVAWNKEEPAMPASVDDYSKVDLKDLDDWLTMAEAHGLYVILRPGPYICAEWDCGGFPQWLITKRPADYKGFWLRSDEPTFVAWSKHWYHAVNLVVAKHQLTHRTPGSFGIILYQLENEYGGNQPDDVEVRYLHALGQQAMDDGIDVPLFTCWTGVVRGSRDPVLRQVYDSCNFYPGLNVTSIGGSIDQLRREQPDAPLQTTELQGGWFSNPGNNHSLSQSWTDVLSQYSPAQIQNLTLYAIEKGDRVTNYYMLFGGTNFGDWAPQNITTSYDYSAPIREIGCVGEKYQRVAAIGAMLKEHGEQLARAKLTPCDTTVPDKDVSIALLSTPNGDRYFFVRNRDKSNPHAGKATAVFSFMPLGKMEVRIDYDLEAMGSKILYVRSGDTKSEDKLWLPNVAPEIKRPADDLPVTIKLTQAMTKADPGPVKWEALKNEQALEQMGIYDRRFVFYRTRLDIDLIPAHRVLLTLGLAGPARDGLLGFVNGKYDPAVNHPGVVQSSLISNQGFELAMIYENVGQPNGGRGMEEMSGIRKIETLTMNGAITDWRMKRISKPTGDLEKLPELANDADIRGWSRQRIHSADDATQLKENQDAVFRSTVTLTADQLKAGDLKLQVSRMDDDGWVFINDKQVGEGHSWSDSFDFPATGLHEGENEIAVVIHNEGGPGGLGAVRLSEAKTQPGLPIEIGTESTGFAGQWWKSDLDETGWASTPIGQPAADVSKLQWSRVKFELPETKKGIWVPWVARLHISGQGFIYLNNHPLGRYWNAGPQHDFFLPECWLNFGSGKTNVLTMCLRSVDGKPVQIDSAGIVPVNEVAEFRP
jgi:hypothetical protein